MENKIGFWGSSIILTQYILAPLNPLNLGLGFAFLISAFYYLHQEVKSNKVDK